MLSSCVQGPEHDPNDWSCQWSDLLLNIMLLPRCNKVRYLPPFIPTMHTASTGENQRNVCCGEKLKKRLRLKATICIEDDAWVICVTIFCGQNFSPRFAHFRPPLLIAALRRSAQDNWHKDLLNVFPISVKPRFPIGLYWPARLAWMKHSIFGNRMIQGSRLDGPDCAFSGSLCLVIMLTTTHTLALFPSSGEKYAVEWTLRHILAIVFD